MPKRGQGRQDRKRSAHLASYVTPDQKEAIERKADEQGETVSDFMRRVVLREVEGGAA